MNISKSPYEVLLAGAATFLERNKTYGNNFLVFGNIAAALFPRGLQVQTAEEWTRLGILVQCISKLGRYGAAFPTGGHDDSAHDLSVYAAMLASVTDENSASPKQVDAIDVIQAIRDNGPVEGVSAEEYADALASILGLRG